MLEHNHEFAKPEVFDVFILYSHPHTINFRSLMSLFFLLLHSCYFVIWGYLPDWQWSQKFRWTELSAKTPCVPKICCCQNDCSNNANIFEVSASNNNCSNSFMYLSILYRGMLHLKKDWEKCCTFLGSL